MLAHSTLTEKEEVTIIGIPKIFLEIIVSDKIVKTSQNMSDEAKERQKELKIVRSDQQERLSVRTSKNSRDNEYSKDDHSVSVKAEYKISKILTFERSQ